MTVRRFETAEAAREFLRCLDSGSQQPTCSFPAMALHTPDTATQRNDSPYEANRGTVTPDGSQLYSIGSEPTNRVLDGRRSISDASLTFKHLLSVFGETTATTAPRLCQDSCPPEPTSYDDKLTRTTCFRSENTPVRADGAPPVALAPQIDPFVEVTKTRAVSDYLKSHVDEEGHTSADTLQPAHEDPAISAIRAAGHFMMTSKLMSLAKTREDVRLAVALQTDSASHRKAQQRFETLCSDLELCIQKIVAPHDRGSKTRHKRLKVRLRAILNSKLVKRYQGNEGNQKLNTPQHGLKQFSSSPNSVHEKDVLQREATGEDLRDGDSAGPNPNSTPSAVRLSPPLFSDGEATPVIPPTSFDQPLHDDPVGKAISAIKAAGHFGSSSKLVRLAKATEEARVAVEQQRDSVSRSKAQKMFGAASGELERHLQSIISQQRSINKGPAEGAGETTSSDSPS